MPSRQQSGHLHCLSRNLFSASTLHIVYCFTMNYYQFFCPATEPQSVYTLFISAARETKVTQPDYSKYDSRAATVSLSFSKALPSSVLAWNAPCLKVPHIWVNICYLLLKEPRVFRFPNCVLSHFTRRKDWVLSGKTCSVVAETVCFSPSHYPFLNVHALPLFGTVQLASTPKPSKPHPTLLIQE